MSVSSQCHFKIPNQLFLLNKLPGYVDSGAKVSCASQHRTPIDLESCFAWNLSVVIIHMQNIIEMSMSLAVV